MLEDKAIYQEPEVLLQNLIRFDTTNPPGNEIEAIRYVRGLLADAGIESTLLARTGNRPNLIARLAGRGNAPPLLLYGHVDVVTTANQVWQHLPFAGEIADGYVWGRGALDMKGGVAMMLAAFLRAKAEGLQPPGDVMLVLVSDEEAGGTYGAQYLVENHADLFQGIRYAIGEFGGFSLTIGGRRFYPIQVAEKQICWMKATIKGPGGHGSLPMHGGAAAKLGRFLTILDRKRLPVHITPTAAEMIGQMADALSIPSNRILRQLLNPRLTDLTLSVLGEKGQVFDPLLHNTVNATVFRGGEKVNVIPSEITVYLDGRLLPGYTPETMIAELKRLVGEDVAFSLLRHDPGPAAPNMGLFDTLAGILREADPAGIPVLLLLSGVTDGRFFSRLGIQTYGFLPMQLPEDLNFTELIHAADERIPVEAVRFGAEAIYKALQRFG